MLNVTRLLVGAPTPGDDLRYGKATQGHDGHVSRGPVHQRPIVVWNVTRRCNLHCRHCYSASADRPFPGELTHDEARAVVEDLARFGVPVILFSGGEPLMREDIYDLMGLAARLGVQPVLSSNGTLLTDEAVGLLRRAGVQRAGISLDGLETTHDRLRGVAGAFQRSLEGIRRCQEAGFRLSLRFTLFRQTAGGLEDVFDLAEQEGIPRLCVYHLAYAGRGRRLSPEDLDPVERRRAVEFIFRRTVELHRRGVPMEVLTVDNHADGPYLLLWAHRYAPHRAPEIHRLLRINGGNSAGKGIACIDERGFVHPDQFWRNRVVGSVREQPFSQIWTDEGVPLLRELRHRRPLLGGRCGVCRFLDLCNGNLRARAEAATGDPWAEDPACYLTDQELGVAADLAPTPSGTG